MAATAMPTTLKSLQFEFSAGRSDLSGCVTIVAMATPNWAEQHESLDPKHATNSRFPDVMFA